MSQERKPKKKLSKWERDKAMYERLGIPSPKETAVKVALANIKNFTSGASNPPPQEPPIPCRHVGVRVASWEEIARHAWY